MHQSYPSGPSSAAIGPVHVGLSEALMHPKPKGALRAALTLMHLPQTNDETTARHAVACTIAPAPDRNQMEPNVIDRLREQIQQRLDQLTHEADRLRKALAALDPRSSETPARKAAETPRLSQLHPPRRPHRPCERVSRPPVPLSGRRPVRPRLPCLPRSPVARR